MESIKSDTIDLKEKLKKSEQTGITAWQIGNISLRIKKEKSYTQLPERYISFADYTIKQLNKDEGTINIYIKIFQSFPKVDEVEKHFVSHLKEFIKIHDVNTRKKALKVFEKLQEKYLYPDEKLPIKRQYSTKEISEVVSLIKNEKNISETEIITITKEVIKLKEKAKNQKRNKFGNTIKPTKICNELTELIEKEPIDEQGFVALFCLLFSCLKKQNFKLQIDGITEIVKFEQIKFVRVEFPDACIVVKNEKNQYKDIYIEFEFKTNRYFTHKHHLSEKRCDLIIAWEDSINPEKYPHKQIENLPQILLIKNLIYQKEISIFKHKKTN